MRSKRVLVEPIKRSELTGQLLTYLGPLLDAQGILLGRGTAPPGGGWPATANGTGRGAFTPYVVLKAGIASTYAPGERDALASNATSWLMTYQLTTHDVSESRVDTTADVLRPMVLGFARDEGLVTLGSVDWAIQQVTVPRLGSTTVTRATDPPHWQVSDDVSLHLSRVSRV
jgi:hypothetical protein